MGNFCKSDCPKNLFAFRSSGLIWLYSEGFRKLPFSFLVSVGLSCVQSWIDCRLDRFDLVTGVGVGVTVIARVCCEAVVC